MERRFRLSTHLSDRPLRADARRNRARVLDAAAALFAEHGLRVGIEEIAQRAGVGVGTVCRNFGTKEELVIEVLTTRAEALLAEARAAVADRDPATAFERFMAKAMNHTVRYRALAEAVAASGEVPVREDIKQELRAALDELVQRAQAAGTLRSDVTGADLRLLLSVLAHAAVKSEGQASRQRFLRVVLDGLRPPTLTGIRSGGRAPRESNPEPAD
jgi:AcrR family transcriptional regulator